MNDWSREQLADWFVQVEEGEYQHCGHHFTSYNGKRFARLHGGANSTSSAGFLARISSTASNSG